MSLGSGLVVAVITARTVLPLAVRLMAKHATPELYQLTVVAFCLCSGWLSGYMVRSCRIFVPMSKAAFAVCHVSAFELTQHPLRPQKSAFQVQS